MRRISCKGLWASIAWLYVSGAAQATPLPWGQDSDMVAWEEFAQLTASAGNPQIKKAEFETWASDQDIYVAASPQWPTISAPKVLQHSALGSAHLRAGIRPFVFVPGACTPPGGLPSGDNAAAGSGFPATGCIGEEVRRNWASFQYIVSNDLYSTAGLGRAFASGFKVDLPADAVEFKGDWVSVADAANWLANGDQNVIRAHYYTSFSQINNVNTEIALLAFHISSKQIKDWVWSDFEGSMNLGRCDVIGCHDSFGAIDANVAPNQAVYKPYGDCPKTAALTKLLQGAGTDPIWQNYCLKGSQVIFADGNNIPTKLGNSVIEPLNAGVFIDKSSCITCHAYASFGKDGVLNGFATDDPTKSPIGPVDPAQMKGFVSNDFI
jgi:hypothetical protein